MLAMCSSNCDLVLTKSNLLVPLCKLWVLYSLYHSELELVTLLLLLALSHSSRFNPSLEGVLLRLSSEGKRPPRLDILEVFELVARLPFDCVTYAESSSNCSSEGVRLLILRTVVLVVVLEVEEIWRTDFRTVTFSNFTVFTPEARSPSSVVVVIVSCKGGAVRREARGGSGQGCDGRRVDWNN